MVSSIVGMIVLLAMTDILNYLTRSQKSSELAMEFTMWKSTIASLLKSQETCSVAFAGSTLDMTGGTSCATQATIYTGGGCSVPGYFTSADCTAAPPQGPSGTWTAPKVWLKKPASYLGRGLEVGDLCFKAVDADTGTIGIQELGNGEWTSEKVYSTMITLRGKKQSEQTGARDLETFFYVTLVANSLGVVKKCDIRHDQWTSLPAVTVEFDNHMGAPGVWAGGKYLAWGGTMGASGSSPGEGVIWDPVANSFSNMSTTNAPLAREKHTFTWTGNQAIVWGGSYGGTFFNDGGRYDPTSNSWGPISTASAPTGRRGHTAVWTGAKMIVWGGGDFGGEFNTGGEYEPQFDKWVATNTSDLDLPTARKAHLAVWTGTYMVIFGGLGSGAVIGGGASAGGRYDPTNTGSSTLAWQAVSSESDRSMPAGVWSGSEVLVWGGNDGSSYPNTGSKYNPNTNAWTAMSASPLAGRYPAAWGWTGSKMIIWGGQGVGVYADGGLYDPAKDKWGNMTSLNAPSARTSYSGNSMGSLGVWTGSEFIVFGGVTAPECNSGARYTPP